MQGGKALEHKVLEGEGGAKLVHSVGGRIEVQVGVERGMGGAKVRRDNLEAPDQRQSKSISKDIVSARWLVRPAMRQVGTRSSPPHVEAMAPRSAHP